MGGLSSALALTLTATTILSGTTKVRAAEIADKPNFDFEITGNYTEKKISEADAKAINNAFGYVSGSNTVYVCGTDAKGYIDWDNSAIESWKIYETEVFQPVLSKDANGNLTVATDENGEVQKKWSTYATYATETADVISHYKDAMIRTRRDVVANESGYNFSETNTYHKTNKELNEEYCDWARITDTYVQKDTVHEYVLSENHFCLSTECDKHIQTINSHLGLTELTTWKMLDWEEWEEMQKFYLSEQTQITDAYVIRLYYTTDDVSLNWMQREYLQRLSMFDPVEVVDVYGTSYGMADTPIQFSEIPVATENRLFSAIDFWILPEGVDTVLTLEDTTNNVPSDTPSNDNSSNDSSNENNKPNNAPSDDNTSNDNSNDNNTPNDTITTPTEPHVVDFSNAESQTVSKEDFAALLEVNKESDVVIKSNNGVTFTFARGTMTEVDGKESYDFSTSINNTYSDSMPSYIQKNSFVSQINFNYSGKLPAMASIRFYVGTEYAGKTLYYSLMNEDNTFAEVKSYVVDAEGYMSVWQDHCSSYVVTTEEPKQQETTTPPTHNKTDTNAGTDNTNTSTDNTTNNTVTSPKTNDMIKMLVPVAGMLLLAVGGVFVGMKKRKMM